MLVPDVLIEIGRTRHQELLRERQRDSLIAQACQSAPNQWRQLLAQSLHALAVRIEGGMATAPAPAPEARSC